MTTATITATRRICLDLRYNARNWISALLKRCDTDRSNSRPSGDLVTPASSRTFRSTLYSGWAVVCGVVDGLLTLTPCWTVVGRRQAYQHRGGHDGRRGHRHRRSYGGPQ